MFSIFGLYEKSSSYKVLLGHKLLLLGTEIIGTIALSQQFFLLLQRVLSEVFHCASVVPRPIKLFHWHLLD
jgi:hypothetical protein